MGHARLCLAQGMNRLTSTALFMRKYGRGVLDLTCVSQQILPALHIHASRIAGQETGLLVAYLRWGIIIPILGIPHSRAWRVTCMGLWQ